MLKAELEVAKSLKLQASSRSEAGDDMVSHLESYKSYIESERDRLQSKRYETEAKVSEAKSELQLVAGYDESMSENVDLIRRQLAETSIQLEEQKERFRRQVAKNAKDIELNTQQLDQKRLEERKMRVKIN